MIMIKDRDAFSSNGDADPVFGRTLRVAHSMGVAVRAFLLRITKSGGWMDRESVSFGEIGRRKDYFTDTVSEAAHLPHPGADQRKKRQ